MAIFARHTDGREYQVAVISQEKCLSGFALVEWLEGPSHGLRTAVRNDALRRRNHDEEVLFGRPVAQGSEYIVVRGGRVVQTLRAVGADEAKRNKYAVGVLYIRVGGQ